MDIRSKGQVMNDELLVKTSSDYKVNDLKKKGFKAYQIKSGINPVPSYNRRDYYKICLVTGRNRIQYADREIEVDGTILFFGNPLVPYSWEILNEDQNGYACLFTEEMLQNNDRFMFVQQFPFFMIGGTPILKLDESQHQFMKLIFEKLLAEQQSEYVFRDDLIRNYILLIIHEAQKVQPSLNYVVSTDASARIVSHFIDLLERQFPIDNLDQRLQLKHPKDFAHSLSVHVNHLNHVVSKVTGKSTTKHISDRIVNEAKALLKNSTWSVAEIAYGLGFEYTTHFNNYFKRVAGNTPKAFRA